MKIQQLQLDRKVVTNKQRSSKKRRTSLAPYVHSTSTYDYELALAEVHEDLTSELPYDRCTHRGCLRPAKYIHANTNLCQKHFIASCKTDE